MRAGGIDTGEKFLTRRRRRLDLLTPTHLDAPRGQQTRSWSRRHACLGKLGWSRQARPAYTAPSRGSTRGSASGMGLHVLEAEGLDAWARVGRASRGAVELWQSRQRLRDPSADRACEVGPPRVTTT